MNWQIAPEEAVIGFEQLDRSDVRRVGGKGANLGELTAAGLPVPPGLGVSAFAYGRLCGGRGRGARRAGRKGASPGELTAAGLPVPPGFVVSASAYAAFCDGSGLRARIAERLAAVDVEDTDRLDRAATEVRSMIENESLPDWLEGGVCAGYIGLREGGCSARGGGG